MVSGLSRNLGIKITEIKKYQWWTKPCTGCADLNIKTRYFAGHFTIYRCRIYTSNSTINLELPLVESSNTQRQKHDCFITQLELGTATHWIETIRSQDAWRFLPSPYYVPVFEVLESEGRLQLRFFIRTFHLSKMESKQICRLPTDFLDDLAPTKKGQAWRSKMLWHIPLY